MIKELILFTYTGCKYCNSLKEKLTLENISFFDFDVIKNREEWLKIVSQLPIDIVPTIYIKEDGQYSGKFYQPTIDYMEEHEILEIIKNYSVKD